MMSKSVPSPLVTCQTDTPATAKKKSTVTTMPMTWPVRKRIIAAKASPRGDLGGPSFLSTFGGGMHPGRATRHGNGSKRLALARRASRESMAQKAVKCSSHMKKTEVEA